MKGPPAARDERNATARSKARRACDENATFRPLCRGRLNTDMAGRMRRVNESVRQVLSEAVTELKDPRIGFVTVTGVDTSADLRHARVFVSVFGSEDVRTATLAGLEAAHGVLQARLGRELRMKRTPQLAFEYDPSVERGVRMTQLIDELAPNDE
jgi:ribosome-binding factor A